VCVLVPTARRCLHEAEVVTFMVCIGVYVTGVQCQTPTRLLRQRPFLRSFTSVVFLICFISSFVVSFARSLRILIGVCAGAVWVLVGLLLPARKPRILIDAPAASGISTEGRSLYMHWQVCWESTVLHLLEVLPPLTCIPRGVRAKFTHVTIVCTSALVLCHFVYRPGA
jgi:hypothetical protein